MWGIWLSWRFFNWNPLPGSLGSKSEWNQVKSTHSRANYIQPRAVLSKHIYYYKITEDNARAVIGQYLLIIIPVNHMENVVII